MSHLGLDWLLGTFYRRGPLPDAGTQVQTITIFGEDCQVTAHKLGIATWKAYGYAKETPIQATDDSAAAAFRRWQNLARISIGIGRPGVASGFRD